MAENRGLQGATLLVIRQLEPVTNPETHRRRNGSGRPAILRVQSQDQTAGDHRKEPQDGRQGRFQPVHEEPRSGPENNRNRSGGTSAGALLEHVQNIVLEHRPEPEHADVFKPRNILWERHYVEERGHHAHIR